VGLLSSGIVVSECEVGVPVPVPCDTLEVWAYTRAAPDKREPNEDVAGVFGHAEGHWVFAVADGLGGMPSGDEASRRAMEILRKHVEDTAGDTPLRAIIMDAFEEANREVLAIGGGAGTTFAAVEIAEGRVRPYHVGDSAILIVGQRGRIKLETIAHSPVGYGIAAGLIEPKAALHREDRHFLSNHLGASDMHIQVGSPIELALRDTLLLATDGVFDNLHIQEIVDRIRKGPLEDAARSLAETCVKRMATEGGAAPTKPDDATFLLMRPRAMPEKTVAATSVSEQPRNASTGDAEDQ
jgi:serine/threonine protein phosphatase PrpC